MFLLSYKFKHKFIKGKNNLLPDFLSQNPDYSPVPGETDKLVVMIPGKVVESEPELPTPVITATLMTIEPVPNPDTVLELTAKGEVKTTCSPPPNTKTPAAYKPLATPSITITPSPPWALRYLSLTNY